MVTQVSLAAGVEGSSPVLNISIFVIFVVITLVIVVQGEQARQVERV